MLLSETIKSSISVITQKRAALENRQHASTYMRALSQLEDAAKEIKTTIRCISSMKEMGILSEPFVGEEIRTELLDYIDDCGNGIKQIQLTPETVKLLSSKGEALTSQMKVAWKEAAARYSDGTKGYLAMIGGLTNDPKRAKELEAGIEETVSGGPSIAAVNRLAADVAEAKAITESFELNPDIEGFLRKVSSKKATVADLTPAVTQWLKDKRLKGKLKVTF